MNENFPLVTVIITTYQNVEYLPRAIKSVLGQTYSPIELIVVDDNSPESQARTDTEEVMRRYPDVIYLRHERNKNGAAARNTGIRAAKGEYIGFLDNDDFYFAHHISSCVQALEQNPEDACVLTGVVKIRGGLCWEINRPPEGLAMDTALLRSERALGTGSNLFLRTEVVREHKGFDEKFLRHQDVEFALRIFSKNSVSRIQEVQIVKEMDGFSNVPNFERFRSTKQQFLNKFEQLIASLPEEEKRRFYAASYGALLYTACQEGDSTHINWVMTQLRQRHALTKRNLFLFFISSVGIFSFYEKCKGQIKKRRSQRLYSDVLKELTEED